VHTRKTPSRRWLAALAGASLIVTALHTGAAVGADPALPQTTSPEHQANVAQEVLDDLDAAGEAAFWVRFDARPDLGGFEQLTDWDARGQAVYDALTSTADASQASVRAELDALDVDYQSFWATNAIAVDRADADLVQSLAHTDGVEGIYARFEVTPPTVETAPLNEHGPQAVEWGVADINADDLWAQGITGEGIVVASIDTGVQWNHPALVGHYRGNNGDGTFDHNYNWFDAAGTSPGAPVDNNGHGTHVTGTMVGDDGGTNQIGVAPGATWIAANGCCPTDAALIASGQWTLATTDLAGANPDPSKRPHVINNSWGTLLPSNDPFMEDVSAAWAAAGQFGVFSNGNSGPSCNTSGSPGSRIINYSVGNYTSSHVIASSSSRGAGQDGAIKPDISAPGTAVRSSFPGSSYASLTGTSMASPHVAGAVALLWSADDQLIGNVDATRALLDGSAIDTANDQCGGTAGNNNVFGEGRLDVLAALQSLLIVDRLSGPDRYATSVAISQELHDPGIAVAYVATGAAFPDALAGAALAGSDSAPVLLTGSSHLPSVTATELGRLDPDQVVLFGGPGAISDDVAALIGTAAGAPVTRLFGADRYATAAAIAAELPPSDTVYVATGQAFADALAGAARAGALDAPLLLVTSDGLPAATAAALTSLAPTQIRLLGGESAVSAGVETELGTYATVTRISGANRYETAVEVSADYPSAETVYLSSGTAWPDALAGGALAGATHQPLLLTQQQIIPGVVGTELQRLAPQRVVLLGGEAVLGPEIVTALHALLP